MKMEAFGHAVLWSLFKSRMTDKTKSISPGMNTKTAAIPGGLTSDVQPLNVFVNKPLKDKVRVEWTEF